MIPVTITPSGQVLGAGPAPLPGVPAVLIFNADDTVTVGNAIVVAVQPVPAQEFSVALNNQACTIKLRFMDLWIPARQEIVTNPPTFELDTFAFMDVFVNDALVIGGVRCMDRNLIVRDTYLGFIGDLAFVDTQGTNDPEVSGLGSRYLLTYWPTLP